VELHRPPHLTTGTAAAGNSYRPLLARSSLKAHRWGALNPFAWLLRHEHGPRQVRGADAPTGRIRRLVLLALSLAPGLYATWLMAGMLPGDSNTPPGAAAMALLGVFAVLSCWLAAGFWTALMGFFVTLRGGDRHLISRSLVRDAPIDPSARTAIVMPICNEDVRRVFAGLRATWESLQATGERVHFDFFVLSDTANPDIAVAELDAWHALREELADRFGQEPRIFYRRRQRRVKRKSGNIDDFCRRWGRAYRYMVVLDADSVMSGSCLTSLLRLMEARPDAGIIQTAPEAAGRDTLHARAQQFANQVYGPLFTAGLHFWQLGESHYWGHNAIIRLQPFMQYCALAPLPGRGSLAGDILSHDFVEAALMRRAGYGVWIAYDLPGSYEETPPNLLDELKRDRRWCHGNLMNARLMFARGMHPVHRAVFLTGALSYVSAPLWFGFLALSSWILLTHASSDPRYFVMPHQLFPLWPSWNPQHALPLVAAVVTLLFLPKVLAAIVAGVRNAAAFGGAWNLAKSVIGEMLLSALLAPVRMLFHTRFVLAGLSGWSVQWKSPARADESTTWGEAIRRHGFQMVLGAAWFAVFYKLAPAFAPWVAPVALGWFLAVPLSVFTSRASIGSRLRNAGWFLTPAETQPPAELLATENYAGAPRPLARFADAVVDPEIHGVVSQVARERRSPVLDRVRGERIERALLSGPDALRPAERLAILADTQALQQLYFAVRTAPAHPDWYLSASAARRATVARFGTHEAPAHARGHGTHAGSQATRERAQPRLPLGAVPQPAR